MVGEGFKSVNRRDGPFKVIVLFSGNYTQFLLFSSRLICKSGYDSMDRNTYIFKNFGSALRIAVIFLFVIAGNGCKTTDKADAESATVNPSDPSAVAPGSANGQGNPANTTAAYQGTTQGGVQTTYSGLKYEVLRAGTGQRPRSYNRVKVHYRGTLLNGKVFDSSYARKQPFTFGLSGGVISGWIEGVALMREGAKYRFTIPPHLAYGAAGSPPKIGPNETLVFEIELLQILY